VSCCSKTLCPCEEEVNDVSVQHKRLHSSAFVNISSLRRARSSHHGHALTDKLTYLVWWVGQMI